MLTEMSLALILFWRRFFNLGQLQKCQSLWLFTLNNKVRVCTESGVKVIGLTFYLLVLIWINIFFFILWFIIGFWLTRNKSHWWFIFGQNFNFLQLLVKWINYQPCIYGMSPFFMSEIIFNVCTYVSNYLQDGIFELVILN